MHILVLLPTGEIRDMFLEQETCRKLEQLGEVIWNPYNRHYTQEELREVLPDTDVVVSGWGTPGILGRELEEGGPRRLLAHLGGSVAPYTDRQAFDRGLMVTCANEIFARSVAEGTLGYILAALRQIPHWDRVMKAGGWRGKRFQNASLMGKRVGIVGYGAVSRHLLPLLYPFDVEILLYSAHLEEEEYPGLRAAKASLEEIFSSCDVISLHGGLNQKTAGMIGENLLGKIKPGALFVNTARGGLVQEEALARLLGEERFYAVLDVYQEEPLPADAKIRGLSHAILMPHMAGPASDLYGVCGRAMVEEIGRFARGEALQYQVRKEALGHMTAKG